MGPLYPAPRDDMHYMSKFQNTAQRRITSSVSGEVSCVVVPQGLFSPANAASGFGHYPFFVMNNVTPLIPYDGATNIYSPFESLDTTTSVKAPDICNLRFLNTMNSLVSAGKLTVSVFY